ncbi:histidine kinase [Paenarthrobacter sp. PH39-S1]|uniref:histidine kinase n=1 Tax=Paenarthrobacter sp. PH39-S1 TaxID=3046204 RepID=UPI0024BA7839|nr:histidine kinase [Paenarthrobacter sp. PH39-S1]MDJ0357552.1 histidine kinase [Paenarthrobacter sp. PH39-S1]
MTIVGSRPDARSVGAHRFARIPLILLHLPYVVVPVVYVVVDVAATWQDRRLWILALPIAGAAGVLQLRHSLIVASGYRPKRWPASFSVLVGLRVLPAFVLGINWESALLMVAASSFPLLPRSVAVVVLTTICLITSFWALATLRPASLSQAIYWVASSGLFIVGFGLAIPAAGAAVRVLTELQRARSDLAEQVVNAERTRVARDLHDLVGQSLSAVSLKGDLALRLLAAKQRAAARKEIAGLTEVAGTASR